MRGARTGTELVGTPQEPGVLEDFPSAQEAIRVRGARTGTELVGTPQEPGVLEDFPSARKRSV